MNQDPSKTDIRLSRRERQILDIVYARGSASATDIQEDLLPDELSNSSVRTFLRILSEKELLSRKKEGRQFIYSPTQEPPKAGASALQKVLDTFFNGSVQQAVAGLMQESDRIDQDELSKLEALITDAKKEGR